MEASAGLGGVSGSSGTTGSGGTTGGAAGTGGEGLAKEACIDTKRVYASGCSNGGGMTLQGRLRRGRPDRGRGAGRFRLPSPDVMFPGAPKNFATWREPNTCSDQPQPLPQHSACQAYDMCKDGAETILCTVQNGTHCGNYRSFGIIDIA